MSMRATAIYAPLGASAPRAATVTKLTHLEDLSLARRAGAGDASARRDLLRRISPVLERVVFRIAGSGADGEDALQLSMLEILQATSGFRGESSLERWASRIAVRTTLGWLRRQRRTAAHLEDEVDVGEVPDPALLPDNLTVLPRPIEAYLEELPGPQRTALVLFHTLEYALADIASLEGVSENTIKSRLFHGRRRLRKLVTRDLVVEEIRVERRSGHGSP